jgi:hypothetical protein
MRITERDGRLLRWINGHGFVTLRQVARWLGTNYQTAQRRVRLLYNHGFLDRRWLVHGDRAHWLTPAGRALCGDSLPLPKDIRLGSYRHDSLLVDLDLALVAETGGRFVPERRLRQMLKKNRVGALGHVADGLLYVAGEKQPVVIELELSTKASRRLETIMRGYTADFDVHWVWYFVECDAVRRHLMKAAEAYALIKIFDLPSAMMADAGRIASSQMASHGAKAVRRSDAEFFCRKDGCGQGRRQPPGGEALTASDRRLAAHHRIEGPRDDNGEWS